MLTRQPYLITDLTPAPSLSHFFLRLSLFPARARHTPVEYRERVCAFARRKATNTRVTRKVVTRAARHSGGDGGVLWCYFNTLCVYIERQTARNFILSPKGDAARVT